MRQILALTLLQAAFLILPSVSMAQTISRKHAKTLLVGTWKICPKKTFGMMNLCNQCDIQLGMEELEKRSTAMLIQFQEDGITTFKVIGREEETTSYELKRWANSKGICNDFDNLGNLYFLSIYEDYDRTRDDGFPIIVISKELMYFYSKRCVYAMERVEKPDAP